MKINANFRLFASANFDAGRYVPSPAIGVNRFMLDRIGSERARATTIVRYVPNSKFPLHTHIGGEEFLVLDGTFHDEHGSFPANTYVRNPIGSNHAPWVEDDGCTIMVKLLQMAEDTTEGEGMTDPLYVNLDSSKESNGIPTDFGTTLQLYTNEQTGERVEMLWVNPGCSIPTTRRSSDDSEVAAAALCMGGEELFIMNGSLDLNNGRDVYDKWGWLRFPVGGTRDRSTLRAGDNGAQVYRKTGHLTDKALSMEKIQITED